MLLCLAEALSLHLFVGETEKFVSRFGRTHADGVTDVAFDPERDAAGNRQGTKLLLNTFDDEFSVLGTCFDHQDGKLVAAVARDQIGTAG